jgi:hypothetical protein
MGIPFYVLFVSMAALFNLIGWRRFFLSGGNGNGE